MISIKTQGNFKNSNRFLRNIFNVNYERILDRYGREGVTALSKATPLDSGLTSKSWSYKITKKNNQYKLEWFNDNMSQGVPIAILLQYGHATRNGSFVQGVDFINPALQPVFEKLANDAWREVTNV